MIRSGRSHVTHQYLIGTLRRLVFNSFSLCKVVLVTWRHCSRSDQKKETVGPLMLFSTAHTRRVVRLRPPLPMFVLAPIESLNLLYCICSSSEQRLHQLSLRPLGNKICSCLPVSGASVNQTPLPGPPACCGPPRTPRRSGRI